MDRAAAAQSHAPEPTSAMEAKVAAHLYKAIDAIQVTLDPNNYIPNVGTQSPLDPEGSNVGSTTPGKAKAFPTTKPIPINAHSKLTAPEVVFSHFILFPSTGNSSPDDGECGVRLDMAEVKAGL
ncbi:MAG: hypothetical protein Q9213_000738 [Squamulea squamosa]